MENAWSFKCCAKQESSGASGKLIIAKNVIAYNGNSDSGVMGSNGCWAVLASCLQVTFSLIFYFAGGELLMATSTHLTAALLHTNRREQRQ